MFRCWLILVGFAVIGFAGCSDNAPKRFRVSGTAKFEGQPIPYGEVLFTPDGAKGNSGPQGIAKIRDGKFDTAGTDKGFAGGPTVLRVTGLTGEGGKLMCEFELQVDLPRGEATYDINGKKSDEKAGKKTEI